MKRLAFTDRWVRTVKPADGTREDYADAACEGLCLRVGKRVKTWTARIRVAGERHRVTIGTYPEITLAAARLMVTDGTAHNLATSRKDEETPQIRMGSLGDLVALKISAMEAVDSRNVPPFRHYLETGPDNALAVIGADTPAAEVTPAHVTDWLRRLHARGVRSYHPRQMLSSAFSYAMEADYDPTRPTGNLRFEIPANPVTAVGGPKSSGVRDRFLNREELATVWHRFGGEVVGPSATTCILTIIAMGGVRVEEVLRARAEQIEMRDGTPWLAWEKTKNGQPHTLPMTRHAAELVRWTQRIFPSEWLFPSPRDPDKPLTTTSLPQAVRRWCDHMAMERWQPRDLRRTMKTHLNEAHPDLAALGATDIWHNHGRTATVARRHYDRAEYVEVKLKVAAAIDAMLSNLTPADERPGWPARPISEKPPERPSSTPPPQTTRL